MSETGTAVPRPGRRRGAARERLLAAAARRFYADGVAATGIDTITAEAGVAKMSLYNNFASKADLVRAYLDARHEEWLDLYRRRLQEARARREGGRQDGGGAPDGRDGAPDARDGVSEGRDRAPDGREEAPDGAPDGRDRAPDRQDRAPDRQDRVSDGRDGVLAVFDAYADHAALAYEHGFRGCGLLNAAAELPAGDEGRAVVRRHKEEVEELLAGHLGELLPGRPEEARRVAEHLSFLLEGAMARAGLEGAGTRLDHARAMAADLLDRL
ncbi:TetR family transcriptional regulator [Streptomyces sp. NPDC030392]|uniref:TetR/AcrR family transcriptional regulator n=1 Tax=Streptomyces sp. NPDC030392 TaxID=3155468 RepID=UPI0033DE682B